MKQFKDIHMIGIISGFCGILAMLPIEQIFLRTGLSTRSFSEAAAGVWVKSNREAKTLEGRILGLIMEFGLGGVVGVIKTKLLVKNGLKHLIPKGLAFGMTTGAFITAILSGFSRNRTAPGDARTNLGYVLKSGVYGIVTTLMIVKITDKSLFQQSQIPVRPDESKGDVLSYFNGE